MERTNNIKLLRVAKGLKQKELADAIHVHQTAVSQWENGRSTPDPQTSEALAEFFDVSLDYLLGRTGERCNTYYANNINGSSLVQGNGSVSVGEVGQMSKEEIEILRIYRALDVRGRTKLLNFAFDMEEQAIKVSKDDS